MQLQIELGEEAKMQSVEAGFASVQEYVYTLLRKDHERLAIQKGYEDVQAGRMRPFEEFDAEMRKDLGITPES